MPAHPSPFITVRGLEKSIGTQQILRGINLSIHHGESLVIIGGSGTGKSVFFDHRDPETAEWLTKLTF